MSWGITIKDVFVSHTTKDRIEYDIEQLRDEIALYETRIAMLIAAPIDSLRTVDVEGEPITWDDYVPNMLLGLFYEYKEAVKRLNLLEIAIDNETVEDD
jgi:hypothetical protein